jgi:hypothetical protein
MALRTTLRTLRAAAATGRARAAAAIAAAAIAAATGIPLALAPARRARRHGADLGHPGHPDLDRRHRGRGR